MIIPLDMLSPLLVKDVHPLIQHNRVARFFCRPNAFNGKCTTDCHNCKPYLQPVFQNLVDDKDPIPLLVWRLRNASAKMAEADGHAAVEPKDEWGITIPIEERKNPFLAIAEELE